MNIDNKKPGRKPLYVYYIIAAVVIILLNVLLLPAIEGRKVQIKISLQDDIVINHEPDYLIVLYMKKNGSIYEVYNGPGKLPWDSASKKDNHNNRHMRVNKLMELDKAVAEAEQIKRKKKKKKMKAEYKNRK